MPWRAETDSARWVGLDVGGANLKVADGLGKAASEPFALWRQPDELAGALGALVKRFVAGGDGERLDGFALTMTGELADCYATKAEGVRAIVAATVEAAGGLPVRVATVDDRWLKPREAAADPRAVAAANWRVAARLVARNRPDGLGAWIDAGSTTIDVIPIEAGRVNARGLDDPARLRCGELVYTGVRRTPVCALVDRLPYGRGECPVAAEWFATTADVWLMLGELDEDPNDTATADGRPLTREATIDRLARCVCADREGFTQADALRAAERVAAAQTELAAAALRGASLEWAVIGGEGAFLIRHALVAFDEPATTESIESLVGREASRCFPAHAAAVLASDELAMAWQESTCQE